MGARSPSNGWFRSIGKARSGIAAWGLYAVVRSLFAVMQVFPLDWNLHTARLFARTWPRLMPRHRDRAIEHLTAAFNGTHTRADIERIADRCLEGVAMFAVEAVCLPRLVRPSTWRRYIEPTGFDEALEAMLSGRGAILVTAHFGSFELPAHLLACLGFDVTAIMRPLDNVHLNRFIVDSRRTRGLLVLDKKGAAAQAEEVLEAGGLLAVVGDQDAGRKGVFVDFFNRRASTYKSIGLLAMTAGCPIVIGFGRRLCRGARYEVGVKRVIQPHEWEDQGDPLRWITQEYTSTIEQLVRESPEQYLWIHRRWKSQPRGQPAQAASTTATPVSTSPTNS